MWGVLRFVLIAGALAIVWYISRLPMVTITEVTVSGGETIQHDEVRAQILRELQGTYYLIIPKAFSFLYPHDRIYEVVSKNTRMYDINVERSSYRELRVSFKEHIPYALWCSYSASTAPCFFMTDKGYAFAESPILQGGSLIRHVVEGIDEVGIGSVRTEKQINDTKYFTTRMEQELGLRTASILYRKSGDIELSINGGGQIFVSGGNNFEETFKNLYTVFQSEEFKHLKPGNFRYVDVRFSNKVFVNESMDDSVSTTTEVVQGLPE